MPQIKFNISIPKEKKTVLMDALEYRDIIFTCQLQEDKKHYYFSFELSPMDLFELGGTYHEYLSYFEKKAREQKRPVKKGSLFK